MNRKLGFALVGGGLMLIAASAFAAFASPGETVGQPEVVEREVRSGLAVPVVPNEEQASKAVVDDAASAPATSAPASSGDDAGTPSADDAAGPAPVPVGLRIAAIDVEAPVDAYGVDQRTRQMDVPDNVTDVAWYEFGPSPGEPGSAVLAAHVDLFGQGPGVFFDLDRLEVDDLVHVAYSDATEQAFRIVARTVYDKDELPTDVIFAKQGPAVLTLITCGGGFSPSDRSYDSNVVVYAVPVAGDDLVRGTPG